MKSYLYFFLTISYCLLFLHSNCTGQSEEIVEKLTDEQKRELINLGNKLVQEKSFALAFEAFAKSGDVGCLRHLGEACIAEKEYELAEKVFREAIKSPRAEGVNSIQNAKYLRKISERHPSSKSVPDKSFPDLTILYIKRTPRYPTDYAENRKILGRSECLSDKGDYKLNPSEGDVVTYSAVIKNQGFSETNECLYEWRINDKINGNGKIPKLNPGETFVIKLPIKWTGNNDRISVSIDMNNDIKEISETNNSIRIGTLALSAIIYVDKKDYFEFANQINMIGTFSFEDWVQEHFHVWNDVFKECKWQGCPNGIQEEIRIDEIKVIDWPKEGPSNCTNHNYARKNGYDGYWLFAAGDQSKAWTQKYAERLDWGFIHEMGHNLLDLNDTYFFNIDASRNHVLDSAGWQVGIGHTLRQGDIMGTGGIRVDENGIEVRDPDAPLYSEYSSMALMSNLHQRRRYMGAYFFDVPAKNNMKILDNSDMPIAEAAVKVYQLQGPYVENEPIINTKTDKNGLVSLGSKPFGEICLYGTNGMLFLEIMVNGISEYHWLEIFDFNLAYWKGNKNESVFTIKTGFAPKDAPVPPKNITASPIDSQNLNISWDPVENDKIAGYKVYENSNDLDAGMERPYRLLEKVEKDITNYTVPWLNGHRYVITSISSAGKESSYSEVAFLPNMSSPMSLCIDNNDNVYVIERHGQKIYVYSSDGKFRQLYLSYWPFLEKTAYYYNPFPSDQFALSLPSCIALDNKGNIYFDSNQSKIVVYEKKTGNRILIFGDKGKDNGQFEEIGGIAISSSGHIVVSDKGNDRLQFFDSNGKFLSTIGETGNGEYQFDSPGALKLDRKGNLLVADEDNNRVQIISFENNKANVKHSINCDGKPSGITIDSKDCIYICIPDKKIIKIYSSFGDLLSEWILENENISQEEIVQLINIAIDSKDIVYAIIRTRNGFSLEKFELPEEIKEIHKKLKE